MSNKIQYKANGKLCSMLMHVSVVTGEDGMIMPETAVTRFNYRPDSISVNFVQEPQVQSIVSKLIAVTYAPNPAKRLPAHIQFDLTFKVVVSGEKIIRTNLISLTAFKNGKSKTLDKTHEVFRKMRKACALIPVCFVNAQCLTFSEARAAERQAQREQAKADREAEKQRKIQEREEARAKAKAEKEAAREAKKLERQKAREEAKAAKHKLSEADKKRIKATAL